MLEITRMITPLDKYDLFKLLNAVLYLTFRLHYFLIAWCTNPTNQNCQSTELATWAYLLLQMYGAIGPGYPAPKLIHHWHIES